MKQGFRHGSQAVDSEAWQKDLQPRMFRCRDVGLIAVSLDCWFEVALGLSNHVQCSLRSEFTMISWTLVLHRGVVGLLCIAPLVGAVENRSWWPMLLLSVPVICRALVLLWPVVDQHQGFLPFRWLIAVVLTVLLVVLIDLGLRPVGGLAGPGGWYLPLSLLAVMLTFLRLSCSRQIARSCGDQN